MNSHAGTKSKSLLWLISVLGLLSFVGIFSQHMLTSIISNSRRHNFKLKWFHFHLVHSSLASCVYNCTHLRQKRAKQQAWMQFFLRSCRIVVVTWAKSHSKRSSLYYTTLSFITFSWGLLDIAWCLKKVCLFCATLLCHFVGDYFSY